MAPFAVLSELKEKTPSIAYEELMSITAGSFLELYGPNKPSDTLNDPAAIELKNSSKDSFDVVVTNFLDTAKQYHRVCESNQPRFEKWWQMDKFRSIVVAF